MSGRNDVGGCRPLTWVVLAVVLLWGLALLTKTLILPALAGMVAGTLIRGG